MDFCRQDFGLDLGIWRVVFGWVSVRWHVEASCLCVSVGESVIVWAAGVESEGYMAPIHWGDLAFLLVSEPSFTIVLEEQHWEAALQSQASLLSFFDDISSYFLRSLLDLLNAPKSRLYHGQLHSPNLELTLQKDRHSPLDEQPSVMCRAVTSNVAFPSRRSILDDPFHIAA